MKKVVIFTLTILLIVSAYFFVSTRNNDESNIPPTKATALDKVTETEKIPDKIEELSKEEILNKYDNSTSSKLDFNNDVIDDLIIKSGDSEANYLFNFYVGHNNKYVYIGSIGGGHSSLYYEPNTTYIVKQYGQMGTEEITHLTVENNNLKEIKISNRTLGEGEEYTEFNGLIEFK